MAFDAQNLTFAEYLYRWLAIYQSQVRERTYDLAESVVRVHLVPELGRIRLDKLTAAHLQALYADRLRRGRAPGTIRNIHSVACKALERALGWRLIASNPAKDASPPRAVSAREEMHPFSREEVAAMIVGADTTRVGDVASVLAVLSGLRAGEVFGLRWQDVDLERGVIHVTGQLVKPASGLQRGPPKGKASRRSVNVPPQAIAVLGGRRKAQLEEKLRFGKHWRNEMGYIFTRVDGSPCPPGKATRTHLRPFLRRLRINAEGRVFHDLRHTYATLSLLNGEHPKIVQQQLGHATIGETMDRYSHVLPSLGRDAARRLGELF